MRRRSKRQPTALLLPLLALACRSDAVMDPTPPVHGTFVLAQIDGEPSPYALAGYASSASLLSESLRFAPSGQVDRIRTIRQVQNGEEQVRTESHRQEFRLWGDSIEIGRFDLCSPTEFCIGNDGGRVTSDGLSLRSPSHQTGQQRPEVLYRRP